MTFKRKTAKCISCDHFRTIYAKKMCSWCYDKQRKKTPLKKTSKPIKKFSKKKLKELNIYRKLRDLYLKEHPFCERCGNVATDLHHKITRQYHLNDVGVFCSLCRNCHDWVHENDGEARKQGFLLSKFIRYEKV